jgi:hypothetical protein
MPPKQRAAASVARPRDARSGLFTHPSDAFGPQEPSGVDAGAPGGHTASSGAPPEYSMVLLLKIPFKKRRAYIVSQNFDVHFLWQILQFLTGFTFFGWILHFLTGFAFFGEVSSERECAINHWEKHHRRVCYVDCDDFYFWIC